jgi:hypothetical protein
MHVKHFSSNTHQEEKGGGSKAHQTHAGVHDKPVVAQAQEILAHERALRCRALPGRVCPAHTRSMWIQESLWFNVLNYWKPGTYVTKSSITSTWGWPDFIYSTPESVQRVDICIIHCQTLCTAWHTVYMHGPLSDFVYCMPDSVQQVHICIIHCQTLCTA